MNGIKPLIAQLEKRAANHPNSLVLGSGESGLTAPKLLDLVQETAGTLRSLPISVMALYADNGPGWVVMDLACQLAGIVLLPIPSFFSNEQFQHALVSAGADAIAVDSTATVSTAAQSPLQESARIRAHSLGIASHENQRFSAFSTAALTVWPLPHTNAGSLPRDTAKITFTSGSTGNPKGVCLSTAQQLAVATQLVEAIGTKSVRHLAILPFSTLLENIAGIYAPLQTGGRVLAPPLSDLGIAGSSGVDTERLCRRISALAPNTLILLPQLLTVLVYAMERGWQPPVSLKFVAVGGGRVAPALLIKARELGLPVYEGYGLSECASVVSLNTPCNDHPGAAGKPLGHINAHIDGGEIVVRGSTFLGYLGEPDSWYPQEVRTGDLGHIDDEGFLFIDGRCKNLLISSFGRNINPEWVEAELLASPLLSRAVVFGDAQPYCAALLWPRRAEIPDSDIHHWIDTVNQKLPDYARVRYWRRPPQSALGNDDLFTANGRPRRAMIEQHFAAVLKDLFCESEGITKQRH